METVYAELPHTEDINSIITRIDPIIYGDHMYYGWKKVFYKTVDNPDAKSEKDKLIQVVDKSKPVEYDNITQQIIDTQNNGKLNAQSMLNNMNQQRFNSQIMLDNMNLQKMASQLMLEINQLKNGGNK
ncbi:hypothetical protein [Apilactobacillus micheneri]|uniref:hypothetical protein n=1 Tax=Apilactobacillus micheneri TaxID=1899430 RepID=UPI00112D69F8|nr:hypothetical protein [Apilactobacillus micheneri]TPR40392.1 hypothetical protein DY119_01510 [Apilactobacillus micheneri]